MRLFRIYNRTPDNQNKESNHSKLIASQSRNSHTLKNMKHELASFTLNSSTAFQVAPAKLGWAAMPVFPVVSTEREIALGWDAMPAFGEAFPARSNADSVVEFVPETRSVSRKTSLLGSFWSAISSRKVHA